MLEHVGDGLLGDVEELAFFLGGEAGVAIEEIERRGDAGVFGQEARGFAQGVSQAAFFEREGAQAPDGAPDFGLAQTEELDGFFHLPPGGVQTGGKEVTRRVHAEGRAG